MLPVPPPNPRTDRPSFVGRLAHLRTKIAALQQEEEKICREMREELCRCLVDAQAFALEFDVLLGGILTVVAEAQKDAAKAEVWEKAGRAFRRNRRPASGLKREDARESAAP